MTRDFRHCLRERVLVFDGAIVTSIKDRNLTPDDFEGRDGCNEFLVLTRPQVIREIHAGFLAVGCDAIETNTFGASRLVLGEYDLADRACEINRAAARLAREVAAGFSTPDRPRFVVGSIGPGTRLPSLGQIGFDDLQNSLYDIHIELGQTFPGVCVVPVLADIRDPRKTNTLFARFTPEVVFHAAAYKHVPMME